MPSDVGAPEVDLPVAQAGSAYRGLPGTGKTTTLLDILQDALDDGTPIERVAASTFRRRMAYDFMDRAEDALGRGLPDDHFLRTTHAICYRLLQLDSDDVVSDEDREAVCQRVANIAYQSSRPEMDGYAPDEEDWYRVGAAGNELGNHLFQLHSYCRNTLRETRRDWRAVEIGPAVRERIGQSRGALVDLFVDEYEAYKQETGKVDFDDMLAEVARLGLVPDVDLLLEDEFQDKSPLQIRVYNLWAEHIDRVVVCGDSYQSLYGFVGCHPAYFERAYANAAESHTLSTSYRFGPDLWRVATQILEDAGYTPPTITPAGETDIHHIPWTEYEEMVGALAGESTFHLIRGNYMGAEVSQVLHRAGIPFRSKFGANWTRPQIDLYNGVCHVSRAFADVGAFEQPRFSLPERAAYRVVDAIPADAVDGTKKAWREELHPEGDDPVAGHRVFDLGGVAPLLHTQAPFSNLNDSALTATVQRRLQEAFVARSARPIDDVYHEIETLHGSKGQERTHVFLLDASTPTAAERGDDLAEARAFFVGVTRAERHLWVVTPPPKYRPPFGVPRTDATSSSPTSGEAIGD